MNGNPTSSTFAASHSVTIQGTDLTVDIDTSDTLLSGLLRKGIGIPYECNAGGCGSCKYTLIEGEVSDDLHESPGLKNSDRRKNKHLACISHLKSDCVIQVKQDKDYRPKNFPAIRKAHLISRRPITHDLWEFEFQTESPAVFLPGQYAKVFISGVNGPRSYSMSNIENDDGGWQFLIKKTPGGAASEVLFEKDLKEISVDLDAPYSIAHLDAEHKSQVVCIAGGSGLAPMISILLGIYCNNLTSLNPTLYYGARTEQDVIPLDYFSLIPGFNPETQYFPIVSEPEPGSNWSGATGFVHEHLSNAIRPEIDDQEIFIAGPPPMVEAVRRHLVLDLGVSITQLHYDRFF